MPHRNAFEPLILIEMLEERRLLIGPYVVAAEFDFETSPHKYVIEFSQDVRQSLVAADVRVETVTSLDAQPVASSLSYDIGTNTATFGFTGVLPEANYRAVLSTHDVQNVYGEALLWDHVGDFFFLNADANHDRTVNLQDYNRMASNFGQSGTFSDGDFNYDGIVNLQDNNILASKFGATLPAPPAGPGEITVHAVTESTVEMNWIDSITGEEGWRVQRSFDGQIFDWYKNLDADLESWTDIALPDGTRVWYRVRAYGNGVDTAYTPKQAATTVLPAPALPSAVAISDTEVFVGWTDQSVSEWGFKIERSDDGVTGWTQVGTAPWNATGFHDQGLADNDTYHYRLIAYNGVTESSYSVSVSVTTPLGIPAAPSELQAASTVVGRIDLSWRDNSHNESGFQVERLDPDATSWTTLDTTAANATTFQDSTAQQGESYRYRLRATNSAGESLYSPTATSTPKLSPPAPPSNPVWTQGDEFGGVLSWTDNSDNESGYKVYSYNTFMGWFPANTTSCRIDSAYRYDGHDHGIRYRVFSFNDAGQSTVAEVNPFPAVEAPSNFSAVSSFRNTFNFSWTDTSRHEERFYVERQDSTGAWVPLQKWAPDGVHLTAAWAPRNASHFSHSFPVSAPTPGQVVNFRVRAFGNGGYSEPSNVQSVTVSAATPLPGRPTVYFTRPYVQVTEAETSPEVRLGRADVSQSVTVSLGLSGDAKPNVDLVNVPGNPSAISDIVTIVIPAGQTEVPLTLTAIEDDLVEGTGLEYLRFTILNITGSYAVTPESGGHFPSTLFQVLEDDVAPRLVPHRTGGRYGDEVSEEVKQSLDPARFLILTNDDYEEAPTIRRDFDNTSATVTVGSLNPVDDDLMRISIPKLFGNWQTASVELQLSNPSSVRLFTYWGAELAVADMPAYLDDVLAQGLDFWVEGLQPDPNFVLTLIARSTSGAELGRDVVHLSIASMSAVGASGSGIPLTESVSKQLLLDAADGIPNAAPVPDSAKFKVRLEAVPHSAANRLRVFSDANPIEAYEDTLVQDGTAVQSQNSGVMHFGMDSNDVLTPEQRTDIADNLLLNAIGAEMVTMLFQNADDKQARLLGAQKLFAKQVDAIVPGGNVQIERIIYASGVPIDFRIEGGANAPQGTLIEWDFDGDGFGNDPAEAGTGTQPRQVTYWEGAPDASHIHLPAASATRRKTFAVRARITPPGANQSSIVLERPLHVALTQQTILHDLPAYLPSDEDLSNQWLRDTYRFHDGINGIQWSNFADVDQIVRTGDFRKVLGDPNLEPIMEQNRLILGRDVIPNLAGGMATLLDPGPAQGNAFPNAKVVGTVIYTGPSSYGFQWDKPELDFFIEHERNQVRLTTDLRTGTSAQVKVFAAYLTSPNPNAGKLTNVVKTIWNELDREFEDVSRAASGGVNGNISWNLLAERLKAFWTVYSQCVSNSPNQPGSLTQIRLGEARGDLPAGTYAAAYNRVLEVYEALPWPELRTIRNDPQPGPAGLVRQLPYRFLSPAFAGFAHPRP